MAYSFTSCTKWFPAPSKGPKMPEGWTTTASRPWAAASSTAWVASALVFA